jgi:hydroxymethylpyrimidine pyrophosphatase-like HAD family hydrolase
VRYLALATDYDGTLAHDGKVDDATLAALDRLRGSGRRLLMVTGRELDDLFRTFDHIDKFDRIVAENGALLYDPASGKETCLAEPPPPEFAERVRRSGAVPFSVGRVIVATRTPWDGVVLDSIRDMGLELQVIFNKGAVMVLPSGVNKATGLRCALEEIGLSAHNTVGIGDAENDHAFLAACEAGVAVANSLPALKERADWVTQGARGAGVQELINEMLEDDLANRADRLRRHDVLLGRSQQGDVCLPVYGSTALLAGMSGGGKSTLTTGFMERLGAAGYQFCAIDPEGDYQNFPTSIVLGDSDTIPTTDEVLSVLDRSGVHAIVNLLGVRFDDRPQYFNTLISAIKRYRQSTGRPHWLVIDEAHHVLPASEPPPDEQLDLRSTFLITLDPSRINSVVHPEVTHVLAVGEEPAEIIKSFCQQCGVQQEPELPDGNLARGQALLWRCGSAEDPVLLQVEPGTTERVRHSRKYATVELSPDRSFYFRGADERLNLRAANLTTFVQMLEGVDDETWLYHLKRGEYSAWFRQHIENDELAEAAARIEQEDLEPAESRAAIRSAIERRYALPA